MAMNVVYTAHSPDVAPNYLLLFGHLKCEMAEFTARSLEGILSEIRGIFADIPKETLAAAYNM
jgi:hypothetical protein